MTNSTTHTASFDSTLNAAREVVYRYTAMALFDPRVRLWGRLVDRQLQNALGAACELIREEEGAAASELALGELPLDHLDPSEMFARLPGSRDGLNAEYERTFGLLATSPNPPYETEYINEKLTFQRSHHLADIAGFYHAFGLRVGGDRHERPDHVALELEFMAFLIGLECREAEGLEAVSREQSAICRGAQTKFLADHLAWWVPAFAKLLSKEHPDGFYAAVGKLLSSLVPAERNLLGVNASTRAARPTSLERPEECDGCLLQV